MTCLEPLQYVLLTLQAGFVGALVLFVAIWLVVKFTN